MTIVVQSLPDQIYDLVRDRIVAGEIGSEGPIRQDTLAAEFGVSKIPLREALARLERDGLVVAEANRGYFIRPMTIAEVEDIFALRLSIEPDAAGAAAALATADERSAPRAALAAWQAALERAQDAGRLNRDFHLALVRPCRRAVTTELVERLHVMAERYCRKHLEPEGRNLRASAEHEQILGAWETGNVQETAALTKAHIAATLADLREQVSGES